jgi:ribosomal protein S8E
MPQESELQTATNYKQVIAFLEEKQKQIQTLSEKRRAMLKELILGDNHQVEALLPTMANLALSTGYPTFMLRRVDLVIRRCEVPHLQDSRNGIE